MFGNGDRTNYPHTEKLLYTLFEINKVTLKVRSIWVSNENAESLQYPKLSSLLEAPNQF